MILHCWTTDEYLHLASTCTFVWISAFKSACNMLCLCALCVSTDKLFVSWFSMGKCHLLIRSTQSVTFSVTPIFMNFVLTLFKGFYIPLKSSQCFALSCSCSWYIQLKMCLRNGFIKKPEKHFSPLRTLTLLVGGLEFTPSLPSRMHANNGNKRAFHRCPQTA